MAQPVTERERDDRERDMAMVDPLPRPMGAALTASMTGPEMAVSPPGASWERERKTFWLSRSGLALAQGEKKSDDGGKRERGNLPGGTCPVRLKSPKMILKVTSLREVTGARICSFYLCISFYPIK